MKLDLHKLFLQVAAAGGAEAVSKEGTWSSVLSAVFAVVDVAPGAAAQLRLLYEEVLQAFERRCVKKVEGSTAPAKYASSRAFALIVRMAVLTLRCTGPLARRCQAKRLTRRPRPQRTRWNGATAHTLSSRIFVVYVCAAWQGRCKASKARG